MGGYELPEKGCGPVAVYNALKSSGLDFGLATIINDLDKHSYLYDTFGSNPLAIKPYLESKGLDVNVIKDIDKTVFTKEVCGNETLMFCYLRKPFTNGGHYITLVKNGVSSGGDDLYAVYNSGKNTSEIKTLNEFLDTGKRLFTSVLSINKKTQLSSKK